MTLPHLYPPTWRERLTRRLGLWPVYGRCALVWWKWAHRQIRPTHRDAPEVSHRYTQLKQEFSK